MANPRSSSKKSHQLKSRHCQKRGCEKPALIEPGLPSPHRSAFCQNHTCRPDGLSICGTPKRTKHPVCNFHHRCKHEGCHFKPGESDRPPTWPAYCPRHRCKLPGCWNGKAELGKRDGWCAHHLNEQYLALLCETEGCTAYKAEESQHCEAHKCPHCLNPSQLGNVCKDHVVCIAPGCEAVSTLDAQGNPTELCKDHHRCSWTWGCPKFAEGGASLCQDHKCSVEWCSLERDKRQETQLGFCAYHKCFIDGCHQPTPNSGGDMRHRFCEAHTCRWKSCYKRASLLDGYLCEEHLRPSPDEAHLQSPSESGYGDFSEARTYHECASQAKPLSAAVPQAPMPASGIPSPPHTGHGSVHSPRRCSYCKS